MEELQLFLLVVGFILGQLTALALADRIDSWLRKADDAWRKWRKR